MSDSTSFIGRQLGPYRVHARLGAGGMGEVYRARDSRLGRDVAVKILPPRFASDPDRRARFEREARILASLNHAHIAAIHGLEETDDVQALVLELVEGETLADRLSRGPIPVPEALAIADQIADALEAAHEQGIVHRDLKPGNIKLTPAGTVKVLDFGLAKAVGAEIPHAGFTEATTVTSGGTREGVILGTPAYMSPEQARGQPVDKRTDIWAFGCVLFELLSGQVAFPGATFSDTIVSILERSPDWAALPATTPVVVREVLARCLEKQPKDRLRDIGDARLELRAALTQAVPSRIGRVGGRRTAWHWLWGGVAVAGAAVVATRVLPGIPRSDPPAAPIRLNLTFEGLTGEGGTPVPSPDGKHFVFQAFDVAGRRLLWLRPLESDAARSLPGTEEAEQPFWYPDGRWVGFFAQEKLRRVSVAGGTPQQVADIPGTAGGFSNGGAAVNERGDVIFSAANRGPLFHVRDSDGVMRQLTRLDSSRAENSHRYPTFLPDGRRFLFLARSGLRENNALYLGTLDSADTRRLMVLHSNVAYVPPRDGRAGRLLYLRDGTLVAHRFNGDDLVGEPHEVVERVEYAPPSLLARFAVSSDGSVLIFRPAGPGRNQLRWVDRKGTPLALFGQPGDFVQPRISPDGGRVLVSRPDAQGNRDVWSLETARGVATRLTTHAANDWWPVWSPDGGSILFASDRDGRPLVVTYLKTSMDPGSDESRLVEVRTAAGLEAVPGDWSADRRWVAFTTGGGAPVRDIWVVPTVGDRKPFTFLATPSVENNPRFSPDGRWIAYTSNESGRYEVYVRPFAGAPAAPGGKIQVSIAGGDFPVWRRDGRELFFIGSDLRIHSVQTAGLGRPAGGPQPQALFMPCQDTVLAGLPMRATPWDHPYDVAPDGRQFLINCFSRSPGRFDVMLNWSRPGDDASR